MDNPIPLPVRLLAPWLDDNAKFVTEFVAREKELTVKTGWWRDKLSKDGEIKVAPCATPSALAAVDAASIAQGAGDDQLSLLFQTVTYNSNHTYELSPLRRVSGLDGYDLRHLFVPLRVVSELEALSRATVPTIADGSYFSILLEVNPIIHNAATRTNPTMEELAKMLVEDGLFINTISNRNVICMSKLAQSDKYIPGISDRLTLGRVLRAGEYLAPQSLLAATGVEKAQPTTERFKSNEVERIRYIYKDQLGVVYFKPHAWSRAFRIEAHQTVLRDDRFLFPLLAAISEQTAVNRTVVEPFPQFMADYVAKVISTVAVLYGDRNWHRGAPDPAFSDLWPRTQGRIG